jgi:hypothetical protein
LKGDLVRVKGGGLPWGYLDEAVSARVRRLRLASAAICLGALAALAKVNGDSPSCGVIARKRLCCGAETVRRCRFRLSATP